MSKARVPLVLAASIAALAACGHGAPQAPVAIAPSAHIHDDCLSRLPVGTLEPPLAAIHARDFEAVPLDAAGEACVAGVFGNRTLGTPTEFDPGHAEVQAFHGEDADRTYATLPRREIRLWQLGDDHVPRWWLLRVDTGLAMEGARYDIVLSTDAEGRLVDRMLVGAEGARYRRDADLRGARDLVVRESTGRDGEPGPAYAAAFEVDAEGRLRHLAGGNTATLASTEEGGPGRAGDAVSLLEVEGGFGDEAMLRDVLFPQEGLVEEAIERHELGDGTPAVLALGQADAVGGLVMHVLVAADATGEAGATTYAASSLAVEEPYAPRATEVLASEWEATPEGATIRVRVRYLDGAAEGDPAAGGPASPSRERLVAARYDASARVLRFLAP